MATVSRRPRRLERRELRFARRQRLSQAVEDGLAGHGRCPSRWSFYRHWRFSSAACPTRVLNDTRSGRWTGPHRLRRSQRYSPWRKVRCGHSASRWKTPFASLACCRFSDGPCRRFCEPGDHFRRGAAHRSPANALRPRASAMRLHPRATTWMKRRWTASSERADGRSLFPGGASGILCCPHPQVSRYLPRAVASSSCARLVASWKKGWDGASFTKQAR